MSDIINRISYCIERGKVNKTSPYPPDMKDEEGADEITKQALDAGATPDSILEACNSGMKIVGDRFSRNEVFVPELLMAAKAMNAVMAHLKPFFQAGDIKKKGKLIIGTVAGDLHDIGKNLAAMVIEGNGWEIIDLGVDVKSDKFVDAVNNNPESIVGLSALLTTTMPNMAATVKEIKSKSPETIVIVGGAPVTAKDASEMGADRYAANPQDAVNYLNGI